MTGPFRTNQALRRDPNHVAAYYNRGNVYAAKGAYKLAKSDFSKALELGYDRAAVEARLAELRQEQERREQAEAELRQERERRELPGGTAAGAGAPGTGRGGRARAGAPGNLGPALECI